LLLLSTAITHQMSTSITIKVLLFASAREAAGNVSEVSIIMEDNNDANTTGFR
jgi:hypothetical protein